MSDGLQHAGLEPALPVDELAQGLRALSYGLALDRLVGDGRESEALLGRISALIFRGRAADPGRSTR